MPESQRRNRLPSEAFQNQCVDEGQRSSVAKSRESLVPYNFMQLRLGFPLRFGMQDHSDEKHEEGESDLEDSHVGSHPLTLRWLALTVSEPAEVNDKPRNDQDVAVLTHRESLHRQRS